FSRDWSSDVCSSDLLVSWTPEGFISRMFATMKPYVPAPPPGVQPPPLWGDEEHVAGLLGDRVVDLRAQRRSLRVTTFGDAATFQIGRASCREGGWIA